MPLEFIPGDNNHPDSWLVEPPEAYLILEAVNNLSSTNRNQICKLAFLIEMTPQEITGRIRRSYKVRNARELSAEYAPETEGEPAENEAFWIGATAPYASLRREFEAINQRIATQQRAILNYTCRLCGLDPRRVEGVLAWSLAGRD